MAIVRLDRVIMFASGRSTFVAVVVGTLVLPASSPVKAAPPAEPIRSSDIHKAVQRSIVYLETEGLAWMQKQQCASCHHLPMMVRALNEAKKRNYPVNEKVLREVTTWTLAAKNNALAFQDLPLDKSRTETDYLGPLLMSLAVGADDERDETAEKERTRLLTHALKEQAQDGSWHANHDGRPPIHASKDVQTSWVLLALGDRPTSAEALDAWKSQRAAAADWLSRNPPADGLQSIAMRLLASEKLGKTTEESKRLLDALVQLQNKDGGWSQAKNMPSDAFATGLTLYALSHQTSSGLDAATVRGQAFLLQNQRADGSWSMTSRPAEPRGPGPAKNLEPINYYGTAWATIGLIRSGPEHSSESN